MMRAERTSKLVTFSAGILVGIVVSSAVSMGIVFQGNGPASTVSPGSRVFGNMQSLQGARPVLEGVVSELKAFPKDKELRERAEQRKGSSDAPPLTTIEGVIGKLEGVIDELRTLPTERPSPQRGALVSKNQEKDHFTDLLRQAGDGTREVIKGEVDGVKSKLDAASAAAGAAFAGLMKGNDEDKGARENADRDKAIKPDVGGGEHATSGTTNDGHQKEKQDGKEKFSAMTAKPQQLAAQEVQGRLADTMQQAADGMLKLVQDEVGGLASKLGAASAATGAAMKMEMTDQIDETKPLLNFFPEPKKPPRDPTVTDCRDNQPQGFNKTFMVTPSLSPVEPCKVVANLMTTFINNADPTKRVAQENVLRAFQRLRQHGIRSWLFTENEAWARRARHFGVEVVARFRKNNANTPCLKYMYQYVMQHDGCSSQERRVVFDGYLNGDILLGLDFVNTLHKVAQVWGPRIGTGTGKGVLVVGARYNKDIQPTTVLKTEEQVVAFAKTAEMFRPDAQDYFMFSRGGVDWNKEIAHFVVGRPAYDNWLVDHAHHSKNIDLIDASRSIRAVHQTCQDGNSAGHRPSKDLQFNRETLNPETGKRVGKHEWDHGIFKWSHFETALVDGQIQFIVKPPTPTGGRRSLPLAADAARVK